MCVRVRMSLFGGNGNIGVAWVLAGAPAALRAAVARARGGGEDKGRWFALAGIDQSPLSQAIRARGKVAARDMA
jgi:hypothetical protein